MYFVKDRMAYNFISKEGKHGGDYEWNELRSRLTLTGVMGDSTPTHVFSSGMLVHRCCALPRCLCRKLCCWCWPLSFPQSLSLRSFQTCILIPLDFSKQAINSVDSTFTTRLLFTVKLNCATTCLFSTFHGEGRRTFCSTVLRISTLHLLLGYVHHNSFLGTNSKTKQTQKGGKSPPPHQRNIVCKILLGKSL